jgi:hypothetical protein
MKFLSHKNEAFLLSSPEIRADFTSRYKTTAALYYNGQPPFDELMDCKLKPPSPATKNLRATAKLRS